MKQNGQKPKKSKRKKVQLSPLVTLLLLLPLTVYIGLLTVYIQPGLFRTSLAGILQSASLTVLNLLPIFVLLCLLYLLIRNVFGAAGAATLLFGFASYANLLKQDGRNDPLVPADVTLLRESLDAVGTYQLNLHGICIALIVCSAAVFFLLAHFSRSARVKLLPSLVLAVLIAGGFSGAVMTVYADKDYYAALPNINEADVPSVFNTYGFVYCFFHNFDLYPVDKPEGYSKAEAEQWETETLDADTPKKVNVLYVMGEAFTDLSDEAAFAYEERENPTFLYHELADSDKSVSGHIVVSGFGAGTANTEFDVMTGMQTNLLTEGDTTSAFRTVHKNLNSIARVFSADGYSTWFMHPGKSWFYNRQSVYDRLGISDQTFDDAFAGMEYTASGMFATDSAFLQKLEEGWSTRTADSSLLAYSVTIENHQAYTADKYGDTLTEEIPLAEGVTLSDSAREMLSVYFQGVRHTSEMLYELSDYLDEQDTPTLLVFFGDHRPALGADYQAYREIGSEAGKSDTAEQTIYSYETPYLIWGNNAFQEEYNMVKTGEALDLPENNVINASYVSALVYELSGRIGSDAYWDYLTQARRLLPVTGRGAYVLPDGTCTDTLNAEQQSVLDKLRRWQYYRMTDQTVP